MGLICFASRLAQEQNEHSVITKQYGMDKRQCILEATAELIAEHGLQACPMSAVARQAGCGAGTIYRYFETKDELVQELYLELVRRMTQRCLDPYDASACVKLRFSSSGATFTAICAPAPETVHC